MNEVILIITDEDEPTTDLVIDWLNYYDHEFIRISAMGKIYVKKIYINNLEFEAIFDYVTSDHVISIDTKYIKAYWYRRSYLNIGCEFINDIYCENNIIKVLNSYKYDENKSAIIFLNKILNRKKSINKFEDNDISKLNVLNIAQGLGLMIPDTLVCDSKKDLMEFYIKHSGAIVTKSIGDPTSFYKYNFHCNTSTVDICNYPEIFSLSLFQQMVLKYVELRIFYFNKKFFSSAIFSQSNEKTKIDLKNYDDGNQNKIVPFKLPVYFESKLFDLMKHLNLKSGSIDVIITPNLDYVFLEVNPIGQFEQVSIPCNYDLFKEVANYLIG